MGTGVPELAVTVAAVRRGYAGIALGNIIGSNLVNLGVVLGLTGLIAPVSDASVGLFAMLMLIGMTFLLWMLLLLMPLLHRWIGMVLLTLFGAYQLAVVA